MLKIVIEHFPDELHERLQRQATSNRRSVTDEVVALIRAALDSSTAQRAPALPPLIKLLDGPATVEQIESSIEDGRA